MFSNDGSPILSRRVSGRQSRFRKWRRLPNSAVIILHDRFRAPLGGRRTSICCCGGLALPHPSLPPAACRSARSRCVSDFHRRRGFRSRSAGLSAVRRAAFGRMSAQRRAEPKGLFSDVVACQASEAEAGGRVRSALWPIVLRAVSIRSDSRKRACHQRLNSRFVDRHRQRRS